MKQLILHALDGIPLVEPGDDLCRLLLEAIEANGLALEDGDLLVLAQKIVSKAEDRYVVLDQVEPGARARELAEEVDKDPRLVETILAESREVVRHRTGVLIVENHLGLVLANAGIDQSNIEHRSNASGSDSSSGRLLLLPVDPDRSAERLRQQIAERTGRQIAILINDSHGRAWRLGTTGVAIGCSGFEPLSDLRGNSDLFGRELRVSVQARADELAAAASLLQGQGAEGRPVVLVRGLAPLGPSAPATTLVRPRELDLFR